MELSEAQMQELEVLKTQHDKVYIITGNDEDGNQLVSFMKKPDYPTKKKATMTLLRDRTQIAEVGEMLLISCFIGGDDLYENEDTRLDAALAMIEAVEFKSNFTLLKKS